MSTKDLASPDDFSFPFPPYEIQLDFMKNLYEVIEEKKIGIFESPTGTGKSLSIICGALTWLNDHEEREIRHLEEALKKVEGKHEVSDNWLSAQIKERESEIALRQLKLQLDNIRIRNDKIKKMRDHRKEKAKRRFPLVSPDLSNEKDDSSQDNIEEKEDMLEEFSIFLEEADEKLEESQEEKEDQPVTRIIYCSRTHSQLSQFVNEIQKTCFSSAARIVHLASRQNYCINKKLRNFTNVASINEKCLEMQHGKEYNTTLKNSEGLSIKKQKSGGGAKCPHLKGISDVSEMILTQVMDVEALSLSSRKIDSCPYYGARAAIPLAQVVVIPYHTLLHKESRDASGLCLDNSVIIIDEAHNLLETISHIHSSQITGQQLTIALSQLSEYKDKYSTKFSAVNLMYLNQLIYVISALLKMLRVTKDSPSSEVLNTELFKVSDFVMTAEIDNYNLYKLLAFCKQSKISHKLQRFVVRSASFVKLEQPSNNSTSSGIKEFILGITKQNNALKKNKQTKREVEEQSNVETNSDYLSQPLFQITALLKCFTQEYNDGRVVVTKESTVGKGTIKYLLLEPASVVTDVISRARSVILAGGTMEPISEFKERLFTVCGIPDNRIIHFSCAHVIPKENIMPIIVCAGPTGNKFDFSFHSRSSATMLNEIGRLLINVTNVVPSGLVCFFPSYDYENHVYEYLEEKGVIKSISTKKKIFREPKKTSDVDKVLSEYAAHIEKSKENNKCNGALLFSVVGGKLSEGLNFSDNLGRCVIVIGMPYPNMKSPELQEKLKYLEEHYGSNAGKIHYENLCMKAVNQSVGRSIRHRNDYSSVLLVDQRYSRPHVYKLLPNWMQESLKVETEKFGPVLGHLCKFFKYHKEISK